MYSRGGYRRLLPGVFEDVVDLFGYRASLGCRRDFTECPCGCVAGRGREAGGDRAFTGADRRGGPPFLPGTGDDQGAGPRTLRWAGGAGDGLAIQVLTVWRVLCIRVSIMVRVESRPKRGAWAQELRCRSTGTSSYSTPLRTRAASTCWSTPRRYRASPGEPDASETSPDCSCTRFARDGSKSKIRLSNWDYGIR